MFNNSPPPENRFVYETVWKNIVEPDMLQMTIWRMRVPRWITKAAKTHSEYGILIRSPLQQLVHERATVLRYTYIACLVKLLSTAVFQYTFYLSLVTLFYVNT